MALNQLPYRINQGSQSRLRMRVLDRGFKIIQTVLEVLPHHPVRIREDAH